MAGEMSKGGAGSLLREAILAKKQKTPTPKLTPKPTLSEEDRELLKNLTLPPHEHGLTDKEVQKFLIEHDMTLRELMAKYGPKPPKKKAKGGYVKKYAKGGGVRKVRK
jgi:hypothetical protein